MFTHPQCQDQHRAIPGALAGNHAQAVTRALTVRSAAAVAITMAAMALLPAGAASAATQHVRQVTAHGIRHNQAAGHGTAARQATAVTVTWHKLALLHGWKPARTSGYHVGDPAYAISGGIVYLTGVLHQPSGTNAEFAVLPKAARPARLLTRTDVTSGLNPGTLVIGPNGTLQAGSSPAANARAGTSLAGISYPAAGITWHPLALLNGYLPHGSRLPAGKPAYAIKGGVVYLSGQLMAPATFQMPAGARQQPSVTSKPFAVLPKAARPTREMFLTDPFGDIGGLTIMPNGDMFALQLESSLDAISFPAAGAKWHDLILSSGWKTGKSTILPTGNPAYAVINGVVYLSGSLYEPTGSSTLFTSVLPSAARPGHNLYLPVFTAGGNFGAVTNVPGLGMFANSQPFSNVQTFTSLAGISYPRNS